MVDAGSGNGLAAAEGRGSYMPILQASGQALALMTHRLDLPFLSSTLFGEGAEVPPPLASFVEANKLPQFRGGSSPNSPPAIT